MNLPHSIDIEKQLLAACLCRNGDCIPKISSLLNADDFYREEHKIIFRAILKLFANGTPPNLLSIMDELEKNNTFENIGFDYLASVAHASFTDAYALSHAKVIKEKSQLRQLFYIAQNISDDALNAVKPVSDILLSAQTVLDSINKSIAPPHFSGRSDFIRNSFKSKVEIQKLFADRSTGFDNLDQFQIFSPGLYVIGATPATGKTTFCWQLLEQLAENGESCIYCSYEMSDLELFSKSVARKLFFRDKKTTLSSAQIRRGGWSKQLDIVLDELANSNADLKVLQLQDESVDDLLALLKPLCSNSIKAPVVCIDYLQIIPSSKDSNRYAIDDTVRKLKKFQRDTNTTFIVISSFNRNNYANQVAFESFKESGGIEYSADVIWALQLFVLNFIKSNTDISVIRKNITDAKNASPRQIQLKCLKNRQGSDYACFFHYFPAHDSFEPCDEKDFTDDKPNYNNVD